MIDETTAIAQLVERTAFNRMVEGSSPSGGVDEDSWMKTKSTLQQNLCLISRWSSDRNRQALRCLSSVGERRICG